MSGTSQPIRGRTDAFSRFLQSGLPGRQAALPVIAFLIALAAGLALITFSRTASAAPENSRFSPQYFTDVMVTTHEGKTVPFYDGLIKGKKVVINFIYLNCNDICPLQTARMAQIRQRLGDEVGRDVFIYSITIDPAHDTPELLKEYADAFGAGGGWLFVTGKPDDIEKIRWRLGERSRTFSEHKNDLVLGNDVTGEWSRSSIFEDYDVAVKQIRELDPVFFQTKRPVTADNALSEKHMRLDRQPGEALFLKGCSTCHSIGGGDFIGPDLKDIAERRDPEWLTRFLLSPTKMRAEKDPLTMELLQKYKNVRMPNLGLKQEDIGDLLNYIGAKSRERDANPAPAAPGGAQGESVSTPKG